MVKANALGKRVSTFPHPLSNANNNNTAQRSTIMMNSSSSSLTSLSSSFSSLQSPQHHQPSSSSTRHHAAFPRWTMSHSIWLSMILTLGCQILIQIWKHQSSSPSIVLWNSSISSTESSATTTIMKPQPQQPQQQQQQQQQQRSIRRTRATNVIYVGQSTSAFTTKTTTAASSTSTKSAMIIQPQRSSSSSSSSSSTTKVVDVVSDDPNVIVQEDATPTTETSATVALDDSSSSTSRNGDDDDNVLIHYDGNEAVGELIQAYFNNTNLICDRIHEERRQILHNNNDTSKVLTLRLSMNCIDLFHGGRGYGTGNYISFYYGIRLVTQVYDNIALEFICTDIDTIAKNHQRQLILPWLTGYFPHRPSNMSNPYPLVTKEQACHPYRTAHISRMLSTIQYDFRRMAMGVLGGVVPTNHPRAQQFYDQYQQQQQQQSTDSLLSVVPKMQLNIDESSIIGGATTVDDDFIDDVIIHFRCGDLMNSEHPNFAFLKFKSYIQHIPTDDPNIRSIGIVTQPFRPGGSQQARAMDMDTIVQDRCRSVIMNLKDYIHYRYLKARIRIHNDPSETIAMTYTRMILARHQTIAGISTFGVFPTVASLGTGYIHRPKDGPFPNGWMNYPRIDDTNESSSSSTNNSTVHLIDNDDYMMVADMKKLWESSTADDSKRNVIDWFRDEASSSALVSSI